MVEEIKHATPHGRGAYAGAQQINIVGSKNPTPDGANAQTPFPSDGFDAQKQALGSSARAKGND